MKVLTFDIEEWFHILDHNSTKTVDSWRNFEYRLDMNMDRIFNLLESNNQKATFFCLGWVAREFPHIIRKIDELGHEVACHSDLHQLVYEQDKAAFSNDLRSSISSIEDVVGKKVISYRAPGFSVTEGTEWFFEELIHNGIKSDSSIFPAVRAHGGYPSFVDSSPTLVDFKGEVIKEFPINLFEVNKFKLVFSGGGYFRMLPYPIIKSLFNKSDYVMTYFHPRDFDSTQPIIEDLSVFRKFKSYVGLKKAYGKLESLLNDFDFVDLKEADSSINWTEVKTLSIK